MTKHTPGPYYVRGAPVSGMAANRPQDIIAGPDVVATVHGNRDNIATAHVLAAAPDMLAALEAIVGYVADPAPAPMIRDLTGDEARKIFAALAKAHGAI